MTESKHIFGIALALLLCVSAAFGQTKISDLGTAKLKEIGTNAASIGDTYSAIDYLSVYMERKPTDAKTAFTLATCYRLARDYQNAKKWYKTSYDLDPKRNVEALYYYGAMFKIEQDYASARLYFLTFKKEYDSKNEEGGFRKLLKMQIESCDKAPRILDSAISVWITHLDTSINKSSIEAAPTYLTDSLIMFSSLRTDSLVYSVDNDTIKTPARQLYLARRKTRSWRYRNRWDENQINIPGVDMSNAVLSPDKQRLYFTRCERNEENRFICAIYKSQRKGKSWETPEALPESINAKHYTNTQPAVGTESKRGDEVLYFVSDRPEGKGGLDIWCAVYNKKKNQWSEPKNCGSAINTPGDEMTPFSDNETRTLYFSSNGWPGLGEQDIYRAQGEVRSFAPAENVGYPVNTSYDDIYYIINARGDEGFFTSNRPGGVNIMHQTCCDDLFSFKYNEVIKVLATGQTYAIKDDHIKELMETSFGMNNTEEPKTTKENDTLSWLGGVVVSLYAIDGVNKELRYIKNDTTDEHGRYNFILDPNKEYAIEYENYGQFNKKVKVSTVGINQPDTVYLNPVGINQIPKTPMVVKNVYYDYDESALKPAGKRSIDSTLLKVLKQVPELVIEISSHTDSKGDSLYNKKLSQKRADAVVEYLVKKGIEPKRLYAKGYGEDKPIAPNELPDGTDNPTGREKNRRTEFKIIGSLDQYSEIIYEE